jgi:hypothetical protein
MATFCIHHGTYHCTMTHGRPEMAPNERSARKWVSEPLQVIHLAAEFDAVAAEAGDTETIRARVHAASANLWAKKLDEERAAHAATMAERDEADREATRAAVERDEAAAQRDAAGQKALQLQDRVRELESDLGDPILGDTVETIRSLRDRVRELEAELRAKILTT